MPWITLLKHLSLSVLVAAGALALSLGCAAYEVGPYDDPVTEWDLDDDLSIDENEFATGFEEEGAFDEWDLDDDGWLDENEWGAGADELGFDDGWADFGAWDLDDDGLLDEDEWTSGVWDTWDDDGDDLLDDDEIGAGFEDWGLDAT